MSRVRHTQGSLWNQWFWFPSSQLPSCWLKQSQQVVPHTMQQLSCKNYWFSLFRFMRDQLNDTVVTWFIAGSECWQVHCSDLIASYCCFLLVKFSKLLINVHCGWLGKHSQINTFEVITKIHLREWQLYLCHFSVSIYTSLLSLKVHVIRWIFPSWCLQLYCA